jgi:hypothetical protein
MRRWAALSITMMLAGCHPLHKSVVAQPGQVLGLSYIQARRILLAQGYRTANFGPSETHRRRSEMCDTLNGERCRTYLETWDCQGISACEFDFVRANDRQVLRVITDGEFPPSVNEARWANSQDLAMRNITNR